MRLPRAASAAALSLSAVLISAPAAVAQVEAEVTPFVRVTFICKATEDGETENAPGFEAAAGDYIFRYRNEEKDGVGMDADSWTSGIGGSGLHTGGPLAVGEVVYQATQNSIAGVSVTTEPGPNRYGGTASTNETQPCDYPEPTPTPTPTPTETPTETPEATEEPVPTDVPAGRPGSGDGVTSTQLAGLAALTVVGVVGASAVTRARRQES